MTTNIQTPIALNAAKPSVHELAEQLADALEYHPDGNSLNAVVETLGGEIIERDLFELSDSDDGSIDILSVDDFKIYVQSFVSEARKRFTIAHELGHYFLHYQIKLSGEGRFQASRYTEGKTDRAEWEANWFAAGFLMPESKFREAHEEFKGSHSRVAEHFEVSLAAAKYHARYHGI